MGTLLGVSAISASSVADTGVEIKLGGAIFLPIRTLASSSFPSSLQYGDSHPS